MYTLRDVRGRFATVDEAIKSIEARLKAVEVATGLSASELQPEPVEAPQVPLSVGE